MYPHFCILHKSVVYILLSFCDPILDVLEKIASLIGPKLAIVWKKKNKKKKKKKKKKNKKTNKKKQLWF